MNTILRIALAVMSSSIVFAANAHAELTANANHDHITIGFLYHGSTVSVKGITEPGTDIVIKIASPASHQTMKQKGKVAGFLWMNTGTLSFENVPDVYYLHSSGNIEDILSKEERARYGIGYSALEEGAAVSPVSDEAEKAKWFDEFVRYKEKNRLFSASAGNVNLTHEDGRAGYRMLTDWFYQAPPGAYDVTVYAVRDGRVVETAESKVSVEQVGGVKALADMAKNNGALYGALSILSALGAGFGVGMIFKKGGGAH